MFINIGTKLNNFHVLKKIGEGGMGEVYLAEDESLGRKVALKVLNPALTADSQFVERFKQEARVQASMSHTNIVQLYSFFIHEDKYIMALEYADGITLKELIRKTGPIPEERTIKIFNQICEALQYAHNKNIVHRDIKPSNIMIDSQDKVKIMDFGIAKIMGDMGLTRTGAKVGTLYYMSPEQVMAKKDIDQRTDIYSLGITLFEMLSGRMPFHTDTESDYYVMDQIIKTDLPDPREHYPYISDEIISVLHKMTKKNRDDRFGDISEISIGSKVSVKPVINTSNKKQTIDTKIDMVLVKYGGFNRIHGFSKSYFVELPSFYIGKYQVTQKEWQDVMGNNPSHFKGDNRPVEQVSWYDAVEFCNKLSEKEGLTAAYILSGANLTCNWSANGYRLPTEAEWEYAARGGNKSRNYMYSGSNKARDVAWYGFFIGRQTHDVGTKSPNELGIYDMSGNVWEWCWDWYAGSYYKSSPSSNPKGPSSGSYRVLRGGSWSNGDGSCRVDNRDYNSPGNCYSDLGFRLVRTLS